MEPNDANNGILPRIRNAVRNALHHPNSSQPANDADPSHSDSDDSMPELQSVSGSSADEMDDDGHSSEDEVVPMLVPEPNVPQASSSRRRARSREDVDGELRDRRNPVERTGRDYRARMLDTGEDPAPAPPPAPNPPQPDNERPRRVPLPFNLLSLLFPIGGQNNANNNDNNTPNNANPRPRNTGIFGGIAISIPGPNGTTVTHPLPMPEGVNPFQFILGTGTGAQGNTGMGDFMARFHEFLSASLAESNREDPERAKRLVDALEPVPTGLVKRLERVGDVGGGDVSGTGGDTVCAICWDSLLAGDAQAWIKPEQSNKMDVDPASIPLPESGTSTPLRETAPSTKPAEVQIVSMPCAHVFHASCLIPWFTRPNQTTCPTCRFNIDPEELTRSPPRPIPSSGTTPNQEARQGNENMEEEAHVHFNMDDHPHDHDQDQGEDGFDVFFDMAVDIGLGPPDDHQGNTGDDEDEDEDAMPGLEPIQNASRTAAEPEDDADMPTLEPITTPLTTPLVNPNGPAQASQSTPSLPQTQPPQATNPAPLPQPPSNPTPNQSRRREIQLPLFNFDIIFTNPIPIVAVAGGTAPRAPPPPPPRQQQQQAHNNEGEWVDEQVFVVPSRAEAEAAVENNTPPSQTPRTPAQPQPAPQRGRTRVVNLPGLQELFGAEMPGTNTNHGQPRSASAPPSRNAPAQNNNENAGAQPDPRPLTAADILRHLVGATRTEANTPGGPGRVGLGATLGNHARTAPNPNPTTTPQNAGPNAPREPNTMFEILAVLSRILAAAPNGEGQQRPDQPQPQAQRPATPAFTFRHQGQGGTPTAQPQPGQRTNPPFIFGRPPPPTSNTHKEWSLPSPPGLTLRQRVERAEREAGLRCDDVSCGVGPSDEEPDINSKVQMVSILRRSSDDKGKGRADDMEPACAHKLHPSCLVSAERVAWSSRNEEEEKEVDGKDYINVECPVCRVEGCVSKEIWVKGASE